MTTHNFAEWYVPQIWPRRGLNLIAGPSGAGKTRWMIPQLYALTKGEPVLDRPTRPVKLAYVACDRDTPSTKRVISHMGFDPELFPIISFRDTMSTYTETSEDGTTATKKIRLDTDSLYQLLSNKVPSDTELIFIEAIGFLVGDKGLNDYRSVGEFGIQLSRIQRLTGFDIWGSTHTPKVKKDAGFVRTRDKVMGSAAWPGISETIVVIDLGDEPQDRTIDVLPRESAELAYRARINEKGIIESWTPLTMEDQLLAASGAVEMADIEEWAEKAGKSRSTANRWKNEMLKAGKLEFQSRGRYLVVASPSVPKLFRGF